MPEDTNELSQNLYKKTEEAVKSGVTDFYFGGAYRRDQISFLNVLKLRNARLVKYADRCFCYLDPKRQISGTAQTVRMAQKKGIPIFNFWNMDK